MRIGLVGCGFIGRALKKWIECHTLHTIAVSDPPLGMNDNLVGCDVFFINIHIETDVDGTQNLAVLEQILSGLPVGEVYIRTTVLPGTCDLLSQKFSRDIWFLPEFLTQRTAYSNFCRQPMIFTGNIPLLREVFPKKKYSVMSNIEAEITKYVHNVFGALKVTYFNGIYEMCEKLGVDFENIRKGCLLSGYINEDHTMVPGPDGLKGYGGKCFPKDVKAFKHYACNFSIYSLLDELEKLNQKYRTSEATN